MRTIFYNTEDEGDNESAPRSPQDCEQPEIPGGDPVAFEDPDTNDLGEPQGDAQEASDSDLDNGLTGSGETATSEGE